MMGSVLRRALWSGAIGAATSTAALVVAARAEGLGGAQPLNATSHWLNGDRAAQRRGVDLQHTCVGLATHVAATVFWAAFYEAWQAARPPRGVAEAAGPGAAVAALAAVVDYTITPKRFTPGWELVLSKRGMGLAYGAMAAGFIAMRGSRSAC